MEAIEPGGPAGNRKQRIACGFHQHVFMSSFDSSISLFWDQLEERIPIPERSEIKRSLGVSLIDENAVCPLPSSRSFLLLILETPSRVKWYSRTYR